MGKVLTGTVSVRNPESGEQRTFEAGSKPAASWAKLITNPRAWEDEPTAPEPEDDDTKDGADAGGDGGDGGDDVSGDAPARNASTETWREYAKSEFGVEFDADATRAQIIGSLEERALIEPSS